MADRSELEIRADERERIASKLSEKETYYKDLMRSDSFECSDLIIDAKYYMLKSIIEELRNGQRIS